MFVHYRTQGFIFKKIDRGEADRLFTVHTKDFGRLDLLAKAERKIKSKLRGGLELFYLSEIEFIQGKTHKTLTDAILVENFPNLRKDLKKLRIAYQIAEVLDNLVKGQEPDNNLWQLFEETFSRLNANNLKPVIYNLIYYYFLWNLFSLLGYGPEFYNCSLCQKKITPGKIRFSSKEGGIICQSCSQKIKSSGEITLETIKILRLILKKDWKTLSKLKFEAKYLKELTLLSQSYFLRIVDEIGASSSTSPLIN